MVKRKKKKKGREKIEKKKRGTKRNTGSPGKALRENSRKIYCSD